MTETIDKSDSTETPAEPPLWELRVQIPPGWIELMAQDSDAEMLANLDTILEPHREELTEDAVDLIRKQLLSARRLSAPTGMRIGGAVLTTWEERVTTWTYGVWVIPVDSTTGLNPVGLIERILGRSLAGNSSLLAALFKEGRLEDFDMVGGRVGSSLYATIDTSKLPIPPDVSMADLPLELGVVMAAVPMPSMPHVAALVIGAAPSVEERGAMAIFASAMAHSVHLLPDNDPEAEANVIEISPEEAFGPTS